MSDPDRLFWLDIETTGLDPATSDILEVAAVVTTTDLETVDELSMVVQPWPGWYSDIDQVVHDMHERSGLFDAIERGLPYPEAERKFEKFVAAHEGAPLAGSSVHFDRAFIGHEWPTALGPLHYRNLDVSTLRTFVKLYCPHVPPYVKTDAHRAVPDVLDAIGELRYYRAALGGGNTHAGG